MENAQARKRVYVRKWVMIARTQWSHVCLQVSDGKIWFVKVRTYLMNGGRCMLADLTSRFKTKHCFISVLQVLATERVACWRSTSHHGVVRAANGFDGEPCSAFQKRSFCA